MPIRRTGRSRAFRFRRSVCPSDINNGRSMINTANGFSSNFDGVTAGGTMLQYFCSYGGSQGTFWSNYYIGAKGGTQVQIATEWCHYY